MVVCSVLCVGSKIVKLVPSAERELRVPTQSSNPVYRQPEVSFKQLTDSNQSSVDDMAVIRDIRDSRALAG